MDDRELLEAAAKAAGYVLEEEPASVWIVGANREDRILRNEQGGHSQWNPLTDDGDALRLAVKLNLTCRFYFGNTCAQATTPGSPSAYEDVQNSADPMAGARLAITRAAAQIGSEKEGR